MPAMSWFFVIVRKNMSLYWNKINSS